MDFLKNCRWNSHKNALNRCNVQNCKKTMPFFQLLTASFSEKTIYLQSHWLGLKQCLLKMSDFLKNSLLNSYKNALNRRKVQNCKKTMSFFQCITASFSEKKMLVAITPTWLKPTSLLKKHWLSQKQSIKLTQKCFKPTLSTELQWNKAFFPMTNC